jgi:hypothetical protein
MRRTVILLALIAAAVLAAPAGATTLQGKFLQNCPASVPLIHDDAIVNPGVVGGADHWHTVVGGKMNAGSTPASLLSGPTTCFIQDNHTAYWAPAIVATDGSLVGVSSMSSYYHANWLNTAALPGGKIQPPPFGLRMIAGNGKSTVPQSSDIIHFSCDAPGQSPVTTIPTSCPAGVGVVADVNFQRCWNGRDLDSSDHKSHVGYGGAKTDANGNPLGQGCPDGWVGIPTVEAEFHYPAKAVGGLLDSDHGVGPAGHSMHADVMFAWQGQTIAELMKCVNDPARNQPSSPLCGVFTSPSSSWLPPLLGWANKITYVQANGSPAAGPA